MCTGLRTRRRAVIVHFRFSGRVIAAMTVSGRLGLNSDARRRPCLNSALIAATIRLCRAMLGLFRHHQLLANYQGQ